MAKKKTTKSETEETPKGDFMDLLFKGAGFIIPPASELKDNEKRYFIDTGSYTLNALIFGSIFAGQPSDTITILAGEKATGKTFVALNLCEYLLKSDERANVVYFDTERAIKTNMLEAREIDQSRFRLRNVSQIEKIQQEMLRLTRSYIALPEEQRIPILFVLDSLGMATTSKELEEALKNPEDQAKDMTKAQKLRGFCRIMTEPLGQANIPLVITNHVHEKIGTRTRPGMPPPKEMSGGEGAKYAASTIIFLSKSSVYDEVTKEVTGNKLTAKLYKSRFTREGLKGSLMLDHNNGMDRYFGLFDIAKRYGAIKKEGNGWRLPDGKFAYMKNILENPTEYFTPEVLKAVDAVAAGFRYGSSPVEPVEPSDDDNDFEITD